MSRIRTVKPELFRHEELFEAERQSGLPLRLIFIGLFTVADVAGRFRWRPRLLKLDIMPFDNFDFEQALNALTQFGFIERYEHAGEVYGWIPKFLKHQRPNKRESRSQLPASLQDTCTHVHARGEMEGEREMEKEEEREKEVEQERDSASSGLHPDDDPVIQIFLHWQRVMDHPKAILDPQRRRHIQAALKMGYSVEDLFRAVDGCSQTPHNRGQNDRGERYDGLHLILRSADQIDRFIRNAKKPPKPSNKADQRLNSNIEAAQNWLQREE